jgi:hypothetical protein
LYDYNVATENSRERLIARVRKLLNLSKSPEEHEAARAAENAAQLMAQHRLTEEDVSDDVDLIVENAGDCYRRDIAQGVALLLHCRLFVNGLQIKFRGYRERVDGASTVYQALIRAGQTRSECPAEIHIRLCHNAPSGYVDINLTQKAWASCYWPGFTASVVRRLWALRSDIQEAVAPTSSPNVGEAATVLQQAMNNMPKGLDGLLAWFKQEGLLRGERAGNAAEIVIPAAGAKPTAFGVLA